MSVDWYKVRLRQGVNIPQLQQWVDIQSLSFRKAFNWPVPGWEFSEGARNEAAQRYVGISRKMMASMDFFPQEGSYDKRGIAPVAFNGAIPLEWREEAKRTIMPEALPEFLDKWSTYASDLRIGRYADYHCRLFMYEDYNPHQNGFQGWKQIMDAIWIALERGSDREEKWAQTDAYKRTCEALSPDLVEPFPMERPVFSEEFREQPLQPETEEKFRSFKAEIEKLMTQVIAWNRAVPMDARIRLPSFIPVQVRMQQRMEAQTDWLLELLDWAEDVRGADCGLFLGH